MTLDNQSLKKAVLKGLGLFLKQTDAEKTKIFLKSAGLDSRQMEESWDYIKEGGTKKLSGKLVAQCIEKRKKGIADKDISQDFNKIGITQEDAKIIFEIADSQSPKKEKIQIVESTPAQANTSQNTTSNWKRYKPSPNLVIFAVVIAFFFVLWFIFK